LREQGRLFHPRAARPYAAAELQHENFGLPNDCGHKHLKYIWFSSVMAGSRTKKPIFAA
jgi:hypothetical protein